MAAGVLLPDRFSQPEGIVVHGGGSAEQKLPALRKQKSLPLTAEQRGAVPLLQSADVLRHRGLCDVELLRRPGIVHRPADCKEGLHTNIQHKSHPFSCVILLAGALPPVGIRHKRFLYFYYNINLLKYKEV